MKRLQIFDVVSVGYELDACEIRSSLIICSQLLSFPHPSTMVESPYSLLIARSGITLPKSSSLSATLIPHKRGRIDPIDGIYLGGSPLNSEYKPTIDSHLT